MQALILNCSAPHVKTPLVSVAALWFRYPYERVQNFLYSVHSCLPPSGCSARAVHTKDLEKSCV